MTESPTQQIIETIQAFESRLGGLNRFIHSFSQGSTQTIFDQEKAIRFIREYFHVLIPCDSPEDLYREDRLEAGRFSGTVMAILDILSLLQNIELVDQVEYVNPVSRVSELMNIRISDIYRVLANERSVQALRRYLDQVPSLDESLIEDYYFMKNYLLTATTILSHISTLQGLETLPALDSIFPDN